MKHVEQTRVNRIACARQMAGGCRDCSQRQWRVRKRNNSSVQRVLYDREIETRIYIVPPRACMAVLVMNARVGVRAWAWAWAWAGMMCVRVCIWVCMSARVGVCMGVWQGGSARVDA